MNSCKKDPEKCCNNNCNKCNNNLGMNSAFIVIILFILLAIIFSGFAY